jgi:hypothetical protein
MFILTRDPQVVHCVRDPGQTLLVEVLCREGYSAPAIGAIVRHVTEHGTVDGAPGLDQADQEIAEWGLETGQPFVPFDDPAWDADPAVWNPTDTFALIPPELEDTAFDLSGIPALSGGAPDSDAELTPADRADFEAWLDQIAPGPPEDQDPLDVARQWYAGRPSFSAWLEAEGGPV